MPSVRVVPFNAFPKAVRERFVGALSASGKSAMPLISAKSTFWWGLVGSVLLLIASVFLVVVLFTDDFDNPFRSNAIQWSGMAVLYVGAIFLAFLSVLLMARILLRRRALPFPAGRYLFPLDFVDARTETLRITPMSDLADYNVVHHFTNGFYTHSIVTLIFVDAPTQTFQSRGMYLATQMIEDLFQKRARIREASGRQDYQGVSSLDPFFEVRMNDSWASLKATPGGLYADGPIAGTVPRIGKWVLAASVVSLLGAGLPNIHNDLIDEYRFSQLKRTPTVANCRTALNDGTRHRTEIEKMLAPAALREARHKMTVTAFRCVVKDYPNTPEAKEATTLIHEAFVDSMNRFRLLAAPNDPRMMPFMEALVTYLEKHDSPPILVRFRRPRTADLEKADAFYQEKLKGKTYLPIAPNFTVKAADSREEIIHDQLVRGFSTCFANDVLSFEAGPNLQGEKLDVDSLTNPVIEIIYEVSPSDKTFFEKDSDRVVVGIQIEFGMRMLVPKMKNDFTFGLVVEPPSSFSVDYGRAAHPTAKTGAILVYNQMATRAFDQFSVKLRDVFFKPENTETKKPNDTKQTG